MTIIAPDVLIARHVEKLLARSDAAKVEQLLSRVGLTLDAGRISSDGRPVNYQDCSAYKRALRDVFGDATYSFARVNFVLGGCTCDVCAT